MYAILRDMKFIDKTDDSLFATLTDSVSAMEAIKDTSKFDNIIQEL